MTPAAADSALGAAQAAGWFYWLGDWYSTDLAAILALEHPVVWRGNARDLCLAHGVATEAGT